MSLGCTPYHQYLIWPLIRAVPVAYAVEGQINLTYVLFLIRREWREMENVFLNLVDHSEGNNMFHVLIQAGGERLELHQSSFISDTGALGFPSFDWIK